MDQFHFLPIKGRPWDGRYTRVPGDTAVFHVRYVDGSLRVVIEWNLEGDRCTCVALHDPNVKQLVANVVQAKRAMGGNHGGSFQVNEFGQVLVPASDGRGLRMLVGEARGSLRFDHPYEDCTFTLADSFGLTRGDAWPLPYIGMPFNLSRRSRVYCKREDLESSEAEFLPLSNRELVSALRDIRPYGAVRFLVNPERIVLTRRPPEGRMDMSEEEGWEPIFVGDLDLSQWFTKET